MSCGYFRLVGKVGGLALVGHLALPQAAEGTDKVLGARKYLFTSTLQTGTFTFSFGVQLLLPLILLQHPST